MTNKAIFLDRDGVIVQDPDGFIHEIEKFKFEKNAPEGLKQLQELSFKLIIITNQPGIGRGIYTHEQYEKFDKYMQEQLKKHGVTIDAVYFCPHHPTKGKGKYLVECDCRKPKPGMILRAAKEHNIDLSKSFTIGDKTGDLKAGRLAGVTPILVKTGYGGEDGFKDAVPDYTAEDLLDAARIIKEL